jgi:hypothetical protein
MVSVAASSTRGGAEILRWEERHSDAAVAAPFAAALATSGTLLRVRNAAGSLEVARTTSPESAGAVFDAWSALGTVAASTPVAVASRSAETVLVSCPADGAAMEVRISADDGATWSAPAGIVTESAAIGAVALAISPTGDACLFYVVGAGTGIKRLRRSGGAWAAAGTAWTNAPLVASITGIAACHDGADYVLVVTGTDADAAPRAWSVRMGDGGIPADAWSGLTVVADADAASTVAFWEPSVLESGGDFHAAVTREEAGHVPSRTTISMHTLHLAGSDSDWTEPAPIRDAAAGGLAFAGTSSNRAWSGSVAQVYGAAMGMQADLSASLVSLAWVMADGASRAEFEFDDRAGVLPGEALAVGNTLAVSHGYRSGEEGAAEYGLSLDFVVSEVTLGSRDGRRHVRVRADGPWEELARWRSMDSWQAAADDYTRDTLFARLAAKAGVTAIARGAPVAPPAGWSTSGMALVLAPGESGAAALRRVMLGAGVAALHTGSALAVRGLPDGESAAWDLGGAGGHPLSTITLENHAPAGWLRLQGDGRYAEAFDGAAESTGRALHDMSAASDADATARAEALLRHASTAIPHARMVLPFHAGIELWDVVSATAAGAGFSGEPLRVTELAMRYRRGPGGARYDTLLTLGGVQ